MVENIMFPFRFQECGFPDLADLMIEIDAARHWIAEVEEPLDVSAPASSSPWCCYIRTVIFYGPDGEEDRCETRLQINDVLRDGDERWQVLSGSVAWAKGRWQMVWRLRKYQAMALADEWTREEREIVEGWPVGMTYADVGTAVATWFNCQGGDKTVAEAAAAFNISEFGVRKAVAAAGNPWFTIEGDELVADGI